MRWIALLLFATTAYADVVCTAEDQESSLELTVQYSVENQEGDTILVYSRECLKAVRITGTVDHQELEAPKLDVHICVDMSSSMEEGDRNFVAWDSVVQYCQSLIENGDDVRISLVTFNRNGELRIALTRDLAAVKAVAEDLRDNIDIAGGTAYMTGLELVEVEVMSNLDPDRGRHMAFFADGLIGSETSTNEVVAWVERMRDDYDLHVTTVGVVGFCSTILTRMAESSAGGRCEAVATSTDIYEVLQSLGPDRFPRLFVNGFFRRITDGEFATVVNMVPGYNYVEFEVELTESDISILCVIEFFLIVDLPDETGNVLRSYKVGNFPLERIADIRWPLANPLIGDDKWQLCFYSREGGLERWGDEQTTEGRLVRFTNDTLIFYNVVLASCQHELGPR